MKVKVKVPATSANLGPGFDVAGLALTLYNTFTFEELEQDLRKAGFGRIQFYGNVAGKRCEDTDDTICVLAMKGL